MANDPWSYADKTGTEHAHQVALFMWANMAEQFGLKAADDPNSYKIAGAAKSSLNSYNDKMPQLRWLHAVHNQGHGDAIRGAKAKAEGVKAGVGDIFLPVPMWDYTGRNDYGLYIELKVGKNNPSDVQLKFIYDMTVAGYQAKVAYGWLEAQKIILDYLQI
jgi:hypothetical protein